MSETTDFARFIKKDLEKSVRKAVKAMARKKGIHLTKKEYRDYCKLYMNGYARAIQTKKGENQ